MKPITAHDIDVMARTIDGEAEGETSLAQSGVGACIAKRAQLAAAYVAAHGRPHPLYGDGSIAGACLAADLDHEGNRVWQFDCWIDGSADAQRIAAKTLDDPTFQRCFAVALDVLLSRVSDPTQGATHYWDISIPTPSWAVGKSYVSIGHLKFVDLA